MASVKRSKYRHRKVLAEWIAGGTLKPAANQRRVPQELRASTETKQMRVKAASLLETIIASVIFMLVFLASVDIVSRLHVTDKQWDQYVSMEQDFHLAVRQYSEGTAELPERNGIENQQAFGDYDPVILTEYEWGTLTVGMRPYKGGSELYELKIQAAAPALRRHMEVRHIIAVPDRYETE